MPAEQVGAHGTGASIPPMDEQVVALTLVTPGRGTLHLSQDDPDPCAPPHRRPATSAAQQCARIAPGLVCCMGCTL